MSVRTKEDIIRIVSSVIPQDCQLSPYELVENKPIDKLIELCKKVERPGAEAANIHNVLEKRGNVNSIDELLETLPSSNGPFKFEYKNALDIIRKAASDKEKITIVGDYDVDGVMASSELYMILRRLGVPENDIEIIIPHRFNDGFGFNPNIVDRIDSGLIITVDNGIAAMPAIDKAKEKGLKVLVLDHHEPVMEGDSIFIPDCDCYIDPNADKYIHPEYYDFTSYCGAGVVLKIGQGLFENELPSEKGAFLANLVSMAAVATIADVMPLKEANRNIVKTGLSYITKGYCPIGLTQLFISGGMNPQDVPSKIHPCMYITADYIGFYIAPRINAASRVTGVADKAVKLMLSKTKLEAEQLAAELMSYNNQRRTITTQEEFLVRKIIAAEKLKDFLGLPAAINPFVVHLKDCGDGYIGLHAGRICEEERMISVVFNGTGDACKGSGRSPEGYDLKKMLDSPEVAQTLVKYGGHAGAAGMTIKEDMIPSFIDATKRYCAEYEIVPLDTKTIYYDIDIDAKEVPAALNIMQKIAPFGEGNPEPVFRINNFKIERAQILGQKGTLKLSGEHVNAIGFGIANGLDQNAIEEMFPSGSTHSLVGRLTYNVYNGVATPQITFDYIDLEVQKSRESVKDEIEEDEEDMEENEYENSYISEER